MHWRMIKKIWLYYRADPTGSGSPEVHLLPPVTMGQNGQNLIIEYILSNKCNKIVSFVNDILDRTGPQTPVFCFCSIFAQVSFNVTLRLKTGFSGVESWSRQK